MPIGLNWLSILTVQLFLHFGLTNGESRFVTLPTSQSVIEGDSVTFSCHATPIAGLEYSWTHNGQPVINSSRIYQIGSNLHLKDITKDGDAGDYVCIATSSSSGARQASPPAKLTVIWLTTANVQLVSERKDEIVLKCVVDGSLEELDIKWFHNSEKVEAVHNIKMDKNKLIIRNPSVFDNGVYRCIASNSAGRYMSKGSYILRLSDSESEEKEFYSSSCMPKYPSKKNSKLFKNSKYLCRGKRGERSQNIENGGINFIRHPSKTIAKEHEHVELHCSYNLPAKYKTTTALLKWRKDGKVFRQSDLGSGTTTTALPNMESMIREDSRISLNRHNGSLIFTSVIASDAGVYDCQLHIDGHSPVTSEQGELSVIEQLKFAPQPTSKNLELGSIGKVHCKAQGTPTPQVRWMKESNGALPDSVEDINGTLVFKKVSAENRGNYTCIAFNTQGQINATVSIGVVVAPKFSVAPEGPIQAMEMGTANIHCQATGDPKPTIQWDKNLEYLSENNTDDGRFRILENGTLQISEVHLDDDGRYGCTIGNSAGLKREEVRFIVKPAENYVTEESSDGFMITRAVLITMSVAFAYIVLVVGLMLWCRYRRQARKARMTANDKENGDACGDGTNKNAEVEPCLPEKTEVNNKPKVRKANGNNNAKGSGTEAQKSDDTISSAHSRGSKKSNAFDQIALPRSSLIDLVQIGRGDFGDIFVGKIKSSNIKISENSEKDVDDKLLSETEKRKSKTSMDDIEEIKEENSELSDDYKLIMVKALSKFKDENICMEFKRQIEMFRAISHKGIAKLYGLCRDKDPHYMVLEYTDWGDLKQFLLATAGQATTPDGAIKSGDPPPLKTAQILALAYQIARGMDAIYRSRFIHKDLAARNCIISSDFIVKVSYPALCKDKYSREYFKHRNTLLPIRWLPPECIQDDDYTTKSDIFSFGVLVWELFTQAVKIPFEDISNEDFIQRCQTGTLDWECADGTPNDLKDILMSCWNKNPKERPSFSQLCTALSKSMQSTLPKDSSDNK